MVSFTRTWRTTCEVLADSQRILHISNTPSAFDLVSYATWLVYTHHQVQSVLLWFRAKYIYIVHTFTIAHRGDSLYKHLQLPLCNAIVTKNVVLHPVLIRNARNHSKTVPWRHKDNKNLCIKDDSSPSQMQCQFKLQLRWRKLEDTDPLAK